MSSNIYTKLQDMRVDLQKQNIKKSGKNKYAGYDYYELGDILPPINDLQQKYKTCSYISYDKDQATLTLVNAEQPDEKIVFYSPMAELSLKGGQAIQNLGGIETYQRRYLYMTAWEIVENDYFDAIQKGTAKALPPDISNLLNSLITQYAKKSGSTVGVVAAELTKIAGKKLQSITDTEAQNLIKYLNIKLKHGTETIKK